MKNYLFQLLFISTVAFAQAQSSIGKQTVDGDAILDFGAGTTKGIILPAVVALPSSPANGTFLLDKNDQKIKMYESGTWVALSDNGDVSAIAAYSGTEANKQTIMGAISTGADGVLVLEAPDKALVLPKIASPHTNVHSPYPGMMCYDTDAKVLAVYDGAVWNYWK